MGRNHIHPKNFITDLGAPELYETRVQKEHAYWHDRTIMRSLHEVCAAGKVTMHCTILATAVSYRGLNHLPMTSSTQSYAVAS
jgi:hypothetical protein